MLTAVAIPIVSSSLAQVAVRGNPVSAYRLARWDGRIAARYAAQKFAASEDRIGRADAARVAARALRQDPTAIQAVTTLGLDAQGRGDVVGARRLFTYAQALSRRDFITQLWSIEDAAKRGDVAAAVHNFDIALRTKKAAADVLFPVLAAAINDANVRASVFQTLRTQPVWMLNFLNYVSMGGAAPQSAAALFLRLTQAGVPVSSGATAAVINRLISAGAMQQAWNYYAAVRGGADLRQSRDPRFTANVQTPSVFDWTSTNDPGLSATIQHSLKGGLVDFSAAPSTGGVLLQQMEMLPPGSYRLAGHSIGIDQSEADLPYWVLICRDGRELGRITMPNSVRGGGLFAGTMVVPAGCPVQTLTLVARSSEAIGGLVGQIDFLRLSPEEGRR